MSGKREFPILNGKLLSDLDANGHKIIGVDIEVPPEKIKEAVAPELKAKADKTALEEEVTRAKGAEAELDGRVKELEENRGGSSVEVVAPSPAGEGKAADAKAVYDELEKKQGALTAGKHINIAEDSTISALGYGLVTLPAGETQLQDRTNTHITEDNIIRIWSSSDGHSGEEAFDVDWVHKEVHDIGDGNGEVEWYVARFDLKPGFFYPIVPVKDVEANQYYYIGQDSQPIPDDPSYEEPPNIVQEVSFIPSTISSGYIDYTTNLYVDFRTKRPDTGEEVTWKIDAYDVIGTMYDEGAVFSGSYMYMEFGDYVPPGWDAENYSLYGRFEVSGLSELPKPGDTLSISLELYNEFDDSTFATYEGEITLPEDMTWHYYYPNGELGGSATIKYSTPEGEIKEAVSDYACLYIEEGYSWDSVTLSLYTEAPVLPGVLIGYNRYSNVSHNEDVQPITIGKELKFSPLESTDELSGFSEYFYAEPQVEESFTFTPPAPLPENSSRDFLLCVDLTKERQIELTGVTEAEAGIFGLAAGRTLISVTEPVAGELYASARQLPTENA